eukprot:EG_transcript_5576
MATVVSVLLAELGLHAYVDVFELNEVRDFETLYSLREADFKELVPPVALRRKLLLWIEQQQQRPGPGAAASLSRPLASPAAEIQERWRELQATYFQGMRQTAPSTRRNEPSIRELRGLQQPVNVELEREIQQHYEVTVHGDNPPQPAVTFEAGMRGAPRVRHNVEECGFRRPTPVQQYAIACCRNGRDLIALSQTGSGKTAAFLLPILAAMEQVLDAGCTISGGAGLLLSPTRELATQTYDECRKFASGTSISMVLLVGGEPTEPQVRKVRQGAHLWHATPGRLVDILVKTQTWDLHFVKYLVLDEADLMFEGSHHATLRLLLDQFNVPPPGWRQTLIFAATLNAQLVDYARRLMQEELLIQSENQRLNVQHFVHDVPRGEKNQRLLATLQSLPQDAHVLIFVNHRATVDQLEAFLTPKLPRSCRVAGDSSTQPPEHRHRVILQFKKKELQYLIGTDVLARGLDFPELQYVICYDLPWTIAEFVHRVGRTGRMGQRGTAISFFDRRVDQHLEQQLLAYLREQEQDLPEWGRFTMEMADPRQQDWGLRINQAWQGRTGYGRQDATARSAPHGPLHSSTYAPAAAQRGVPPGRMGLAPTGPSRRQTRHNQEPDLIFFDD